MTCTVPKTGCGFDAPDPLVGLGSPPAACGSAVDPERFVTLAELAAHPKGCRITGFETLATWILGSVSAAVDDFYGRPMAPCSGARCFQAAGCEGVDIDPALRVDLVDVGSCGCSGAPAEWTEVDLCDVVVWSDSDLPPYRHVTGCGLCRTCGHSQVRVTGVWGDAWPIHPAIRAAVITVAAKLFLVSKESAKIIQNREDGSTSYNIPDFSMGELTALLPRSLVRYRGGAV